MAHLSVRRMVMATAGEPVGQIDLASWTLGTVITWRACVFVCVCVRVGERVCVCDALRMDMILTG